jgi:glycosyl transferase family 87
MLISPSAFAVRLRLSATGLRLLESPPWVGVAVATIAWLAVVGFAEPFGRLWGTGQDARCYWLPSLLDPYAESTWTNPIAYVYSPAFLQLISPLTRLPWQAFVAVWTAILLLAVRFLTGPRLLAAGVIFAAMELAGGNISLLLATAIVLGFRWPAAWAIVLLTKVTPGVGLLWFATRREWRSLAMALGATAAVIAGSALMLPNAWSEWTDVLIRNGGRDGTWAALPIALWIRMPIAMIVVIWGARTNRRWAVPVASLIALPAVWYGSLRMLLAIVALRDAPTRSTDEEADRDSDAELRTRSRRPEPSAAGA